MAITTLDGAIAGFKPPESFLKITGTMEAAGVWHSLFYASGRPGAASVPTGLSGTALTSSGGSLGGQLPVPPASGNTHLARLIASGTTAGMLILADRLWHNGSIGITTTGAQTINSVAWPARDENGTSDGDDIVIGLEASAAIGGGAVTNTTMSYTNDGGTSGKTATIASWPATAQAGTFVPFQLAAGDRGVRSVQSLTLGTTYTSGTVHLVAYRILAMLPCPIANVGAALDLVACGMPRIYDNSVPFLLWLPSATTSSTICGQVLYTQG